MTWNSVGGVNQDTRINQEVICIQDARQVEAGEV